MSLAPLSGAEECPANPVARIFKGTVNNSPQIRPVLLPHRPHKLRVQLGAGELSLLQLFALADQHIDQQLT